MTPLRQRQTEFARLNPHMVRLEKIFRRIPEPYSAFWPYQVHEVRRDREHQKLLGFVLMACVKEQTKFLMTLWAQTFPPDDDVETAWKALVYSGYVADMLDTKDPAAKERFTIAYNGVMFGRGKL